MPLVVIDALMSIRIGSPSVGMPTAIGSGVNTAFRPPKGATLASAGSERGDRHHHARSRGARQEGGEAGDVMAAADGDGAEPVAPRPLDREIDGAHREPDARQRAAVPGHGRAAVGDDLGSPAAFMRPSAISLQIAAGKLQAVGGVAHQVGFDQQLRDERGLVAVAADGREETAGESKEIGGAVARHRRTVVHAHPLISVPTTPCNGTRCDTCQGISRRSANTTTPKMASPSAASTKMAAKAMSARAVALRNDWM